MRHLQNLAFAALATGMIAFAPSASADDEKNTVREQPWSQADRYYDAGKMDASRRQVQAASGGSNQFFLMADRLETQLDNNEETLLWDAQGWYGGDIDKLWLKTEGDYSFHDDEVEEAELQVLWSHALTAFFDAQAGLRYDFESNGLTYGVLGIQGLAPQWWELDAALFFSEKGDATARFELENDLLLTQRLILQPRLEMSLSAQDVPELGIGSGISSLDAGLRLRYEIRREFAPYIGVEWQRKLGETADIYESAGGDPDRTVFVVGIRLWF